MRLFAIPSTVGLLVLAGLIAPGAHSSGHKHSVSVSTHGDSPVSDCSDLHMRINDRESVMSREERTISRAEAPVLRIRDTENGGVQVQGWDKDTYSVTACKAADATLSDAQRILSEINLSVQNGEVSVRGPADRESWVVFLLVRAPKSAAIELNSHNGPIGIFQVDGQITARATNGPITLKDCSGSADVAAENGPISFSGAGGNLRLRTQNGPISVSLHGTSWSGSGLVADAVNGPVTLRLPPGYQSGVLVESEGHSPVSCHASVCGEARRTWDDEHRRIEFGSSPPLIRLSTVNGPVSVQPLRESL